MGLGGAAPAVARAPEALGGLDRRPSLAGVEPQELKPPTGEKPAAQGADGRGRVGVRIFVASGLSRPS